MALISQDRFHSTSTHICSLCPGFYELYGLCEVPPGLILAAGLHAAALLQRQLDETVEDLAGMDVVV